MRVIGLDFGKKRIGVAVGDTTVPIATPKETLKNSGRAVRKLVKMLKEEEATDVVIGLPKMMSGEEAEMAAAVREFGTRLQEASGVTIHYIDERLSSEEAKKRGAGDVDAAAAATILQRWLDAGRKI